MSNVISISSRIHSHKRQLIVNMIVDKLELNTADDHLARAMNQPKGRTNHDIVFFMVDINYPSPDLALEVDNNHIVNTIIDNMSYRCGFSLQKMGEMKGEELFFTVLFSGLISLIFLQLALWVATKRGETRRK